MRTADSAHSRSAWRWFPWAIAGSLLTVIAVNIGLVVAAHGTFPGAVEEHAFDTGNRYNAVLADAARQAAAGFAIEARAQGRIVTIEVKDRTGHKTTATLHGIASHPVGPADATELNFAGADGLYQAATPLPGAGQWDIALTMKADGAAYSTTRRVVVP
jgi:nitrogen fixation protein FixH